MNKKKQLSIMITIAILVGATVFLTTIFNDKKFSESRNTETTQEIKTTSPETYLSEVFTEKNTVKETTTYMNNKSPKSKTTIQDFYKKENAVVCHAAGIINGHNVTNSVEALNKNYAQGYRFFEVDLSLTSDGYLVCSHGWTKKEYIARYMDNYNLCLNKEEYCPSLNEFRTFTVGDGYTVLTFKDFINWMNNHDDTCFLLDIKLCDRKEAKSIAETIIREGGKEILDRFVVSARTTEMAKGFSDAYKFPYMHLLYDTDEMREKSIYTPALFVEFCKQYNISSFSLEMNDCTTETIKALSVSGMKSYVYMIQNNYQANNILKTGVNYLISDYLDTNTIEKTIKKHSAFIQLSDQKAQGIAIEWTCDKPIKKVTIYRKSENSYGFEKLVNLSGDTNKYLDNSIDLGKLYEYYVEVHATDGSTINSCVEKYACLEIPELVHVVKQNNSVEIKWNKIEGADGYYIRKKIGSDGEYQLVRIIDDPTAIQYVDEDGFSDDTTFYSVRCFKVIDEYRYTGTYSKGMLVE